MNNYLKIGLKWIDKNKEISINEETIYQRILNTALGKVK